MTTQLHTDHILTKVIWEAMLHVFYVQWNDYKQLTHTNFEGQCLKIQHCLIIKYFITHNTLKHCSKVLMIQNNVWLCLYISFTVSDFITVHVVNINWIKVSTQRIHIRYNTCYSSKWLEFTAFNPFEHTAVCETGWAIEAFAVNSSFLSVDGMTCPTPFESWRNDLSNGI